MDELQELKLIVLTYNAKFYAKEVERNEKPEFGDPHVNVLIREAEGVRILLGTHDCYDSDKPDVQIERQPNGWMIFLHPVGGSDACGYVYFLDDGRSFLVKETDYGGPTPAIRILDPFSHVPEIHGPQEEKTRACEALPALECIETEDLPEPDSVLSLPTGAPTLADIDDCLKIEEAYELASELRNLAYWDDHSETWKADKKLGADFIAAVKDLLKIYKLAPC